MISYAETNPEAVDVITKLLRRSELLEEYERQRLPEEMAAQGLAAQ